ncbi:MAG: hypothetical protein KJ069_31015 [Anaerolineae bacterium]|nr:hypothetical protein [Anaerolineae bacterium]
MIRQRQKYEPVGGGMLGNGLLVVMFVTCNRPLMNHRATSGRPVNRAKSWQMPAPLRSLDVNVQAAEPYHWHRSVFTSRPFAG